MNKVLDITNTLVLNQISFKGILTWISDEGSALVLIAIIIGLIIAAFKGSFKAAIIILIVGGLFYFVIGSPESAIKSISDIWAKVIK